MINLVFIMEKNVEMGTWPSFNKTMILTYGNNDG